MHNYWKKKQNIVYLEKSWHHSFDFNSTNIFIYVSAQIYKSLRKIIKYVILNKFEFYK